MTVKRATIARYERVALLSALAIAGASATALAVRTPPLPQPACFAVASNVCFSGTTEWVARAAEQPVPGALPTHIILADAE